MTIEIVDFPIENGDFPYFLYVYQRVTSRKPTTSTIAIHHHLRLCVRHVFWPQLQPIVDATGRLVMAGDATGGFTKIRVFSAELC
jgi:hypothetical protein